MRSGWRTSVLPLVLFAAVMVSVFDPGARAWASDQTTTIEITGATVSPSFDDGAAWGWWNPSKYSLWQDDDDVSFDLAELRMLVPSGEYAVFLSAELYPKLEGGGVQNDDDGSLLAEHQLSFEMEVYDLALSQFMSFRGGDSFRPWVGVTYMSIDEKRSWISHPELPADRASSKLWGASLGFDGELALPGSFKIVGRAVGRWARGDRNSSFTPELSFGVPDSTQVNASDRVEQIMWGGEAGVQWRAHDTFEIEGGWRYRDWRHDDGPASFDGPFLRLRLKY